MASHEVIVMVCDKCGYEDQDTTKFLRVTIRKVDTSTKKNQRPAIISDRDLCESCIGLPGVNRDK